MERTTAPHPFTIHNFRAYWLSRFAGTIALSSMTIVIGWQVYNLARDVHMMSIKEATFLLGMIGVAQFVPLFLLTPIVGLVADTSSRGHPRCLGWLWRHQLVRFFLGIAALLI